MLNTLIIQAEEKTISFRGKLQQRYIWNQIHSELPSPVWFPTCSWPIYIASYSVNNFVCDTGNICRPARLTACLCLCQSQNSKRACQDISLHTASSTDQASLIQSPKSALSLCACTAKWNDKVSDSEVPKMSQFNHSQYVSRKKKKCTTLHYITCTKLPRW